jgi:hypothetical protein
MDQNFIYITSDNSQVLHDTLYAQSHISCHIYYNPIGLYISINNTTFILKDTSLLESAYVRQIVVSDGSTLRYLAKHHQIRAGFIRIDKYSPLISTLASSLPTNRLLIFESVETPSGYQKTRSLVAGYTSFTKPMNS